MRNIFKTLLILLIVSSLLSLGFLGLAYYKVSTPYNADFVDTKTVIIDSGESFRGIARKLQDEGIISSHFYFTFYAMLEKKTGGMQAGVYELGPSMTMREIMEIIIGGDVVDGSVRTTFPEGLSSTQITEQLLNEGIIENELKFINLVEMSSSAAYEMYEYPFLQQAESSSLRGFLFPDTYEFVAPQEAEEVLDKFLANFQHKAGYLFTERDSASGQAIGYSPYDVLIMASILEREVQTDDDMKLAAGVLYNRLEIGMPLQVDATLVHITGKTTGQLTDTDKQIDHPYNTYVHRGLPPGPIANPGLRAIDAALNPEPSEYLYYLSAEDGTTIFSRTLEEHNENKVEYLDYLRR